MHGSNLTFLPFCFALLIFAATAGGGCAREAQMVKWEADFYYTEQLYVDGQYQLAVERYRALRKSAKVEQDADEAALMDCEVQARAKEFAAAATCYDVLATVAFDPQVRVRGLLHAGELRYYELDKKAQALKLLARRSSVFPMLLQVCACWITSIFTPKTSPMTARRCWLCSHGWKKPIP